MEKDEKIFKLVLAHLCNELYNYRIFNKAHVKGPMKLSIFFGEAALL